MDSAKEYDGAAVAIWRRPEGRSTDPGRWPRRTEDVEQRRVPGLGHDDLDVLESDGNAQARVVCGGAGRAVVCDWWPRRMELLEYGRALGSRFEGLELCGSDVGDAIDGGSGGAKGPVVCGRGQGRKCVSPICRVL